MNFGPLVRQDRLTSSEEQAGRYLENAKAPNTLRAYRSDWSDFSTWCAARGREALPADASTLALYLTELSNIAKVSTLTRRLSAISQAHQLAGCESPAQNPVVRRLMGGIRRTHGSATAAKRPVLIDDLKAMLAHLPDNLLGTRDRALLLLGFSGAFRRSELVALDCEDLAADKRGLVVTIKCGKTDAVGQGRTIGIPFGSRTGGTCPVFAVENWQRVAGIVNGPLFRLITRHGHILEKRLSGEAVGIVVKRSVKNLGYDPAQFGGHSLRAGLATAAAMAGKSERVIMQQTGHRSLTTLRRYIRDGNLFRENAAEGIGL